MPAAVEGIPHATRPAARQSWDARNRGCAEVPTHRSEDAHMTRSIFIRRPPRAAALAALLLGFAALTPAWAAGGGKDCAPMGSLPDYIAANPPTRHVFEHHKFLQDSDWVDVAGRYCSQEYDLKQGAEAMSALEMIENYKSQFDQLGVRITRTEEHALYGVLSKDGNDTWIEVGADDNLNDVTIVVVDKQLLKQTLVAPSGSDYKLLGHMPNFIAGKPEKKRFDQHEFLVHSDDGNNPTNVQGTYYAIEYDLQKGALGPTELESQMNYRNALKTLGAQILYTDDTSTVARYDDNGQEIWMQVDSDENNGEIQVTVVEEKAFQASIKPAQASELKAALDKDGHVALYINFDFDKATLRPDAAPVIAQVLALLKDNPGLKLSVVGNTDNVGGHDYNVKLSQERAASVVAELVKDGIASDRLQSSGVGPDKPIADNDSSSGRAKNRRVELVKP
jgi:outer membrane protein OmpA-like peptidoglycan-associated protein